MLLVGVVCGVALLFASGARRTMSSLDRFAATARSADITVGTGERGPSLVGEVAALPGVERTAAYTLVFAIVDGIDEDLGVIAPRDELATNEIDRDILVRGRRADPASTDEVVVSETGAQITGLDVGDRVSIQTLSPEQVAAEDYFPPRGPTLDVEVVGVLRGLDDLQGTGGGFLASPALLPTIAGRVDEFETYIGVELADDTSVSEFRGALARLPGGEELETLSLEERMRSPDDTVGALSLGLSALAAVAALAGLVVIAQAVARHVAGADDDAFVLHAIGMTRSERRGALIAAVVPTALAASVLAALLAIAASPLLPIGLARRADPARGVHADWLVLAIGAAVVVIVAIGMAALRLVPHRVDERRPQISWPAALAAMGRIAQRPPSVVGTSLASGNGAPALPVRAALTGLVVGVAGCVGVIVFASTLDRLVAAPDRWGYGWDVLMNFTSDSVDDATDAVSTDERFSAVGRLDAGIASIGGQQVRAFGLSPVSGDMGFVLRSGRQPVGPGEAVLGPSTAATLDVGIGDEVSVRRGDGSDASVDVVGIGLFPEVDERPYDTGIGFDGAGFADNAVVAEQFNANQIVVRVADGLEVDAVVSQLGDEFGDAVSPVESLPSAPAPVRNLTTVRAMPTWLAALVAALGLSSLAHVLVTTVRRRRHELATLRALGFTSSDGARTIVAQAVTLTLLAIVIGAPIGLAAGTASWRLVADPMNVASDVARPVATFALALVAAVALALVIAALPAWRAARLAIALALRSE